MQPEAQPPAAPPAAPPSAPPSAPPPKKNTSWNHVSKRATSIASIIALFAFLLMAGGILGYFVSQSHKTPETKQNTIQNLSPEDIAKLSQVGASLGTNGQTMNIGANALFRSNAEVTGKLTVGGQFIANGPVTLSQLSISGSAALSGLNVGSNLQVGGTTTLQKSLTVNDLVTANALNVSGAAGFNSLTAAAIAVRAITISGPLTISHLSTQGPAPGLSGGTALGAGGTSSISGNDTAGTINFNIGTAPPAGVLGSITFRAAYGSTVHVLLSPITGAAASTPAYVTRSASGFQVRTDVTPAAGTLSYDYFITQ